MGTSKSRQLRQNRTDAERVLWERLRRKQLDGWRFRQQVPLGAYIADFLCARRMLIVEVDGGQHAGAKSDVARSAWLEARGFRVLRFWNNDVLRNLDGVVEAILIALREEAPPPHPAPMEGGGGKIDRGQGR
jgi:very-short-patch-repair endonuclease